jgi:hypothetical protein
MQFRSSLAWTVAAVLVMSVEGIAAAQSAPAHASKVNDPNLAAVRQWTTTSWVSPELAAAQASLKESTKKSDTVAPVDLNGLASRQNTANALVIPNSGGAPLPSDDQGDKRLQMVHADVTGATPPAAGSATRVALAAAEATEAPAGVTAGHAEAVLRGQIHPAARQCYLSDPDAKAKRQGHLLISIQLTPGGDVDSVGIPVNEGVSASVADCIVNAVRAAKFAPPTANGTVVRAAFTFPPQDSPAPQGGQRGSHETLAKADASPARRAR